jgi:hypothetical protein
MASSSSSGSESGSDSCPSSTSTRATTSDTPADIWAEVARLDNEVKTEAKRGMMAKLAGVTEKTTLGELMTLLVREMGSATPKERRDTLDAVVGVAIMGVALVGMYASFDRYRLCRFCSEKVDREDPGLRLDSFHVSLEYDDRGHTYTRPVCKACSHRPKSDLSSF